MSSVRTTYAVCNVRRSNVTSRVRTTHVICNLSRNNVISRVRTTHAICGVSNNKVTGIVRPCTHIVAAGAGDIDHPVIVRVPSHPPSPDVDHHVHCPAAVRHGHFLCGGREGGGGP